ncbi:DUF6257 family protein [Streptomyces sp. AK08-02]|uniref:DUF6257 family protein n=1 Tax=Streptomyces sp. AK08-02 TaxID=3028654 RepID=UPI0029B7CC21|nr:DUF6257 family protein [Streptomyces sp. AK08-02]MDX3747470.1 DUF6257 family protein [Streptomyces sp. AK08-02]
MSEPKLTFWEKAGIVRLELRGARRAIANIQDQPDIDRGIERIKERARKREERANRKK